MCVVTALAISSMAMTAFGAVTQGLQQSGQYKAQANAAEYNANTERDQARAAGAVGANNEAQQRRENALFAGKQFAAAGESGIGLEGSASDVMRQSAKFAEMDALNKRYEGQIARTGYLNQAQNDEYAAKVYRRNANAAIYGGFLGAGTSILSGVADYSLGKKYGFRTSSGS